MRRATRRLLRLAVAGAATALLGCASGDAERTREERAARAVDACAGHDGVVAFDDDAVICGDGTTTERRGAAAVAACRAAGGVSAFDDDIVICRDQRPRPVGGG